MSEFVTKPHWDRNGESDIYQRLPKMRKDELERLALLLDNERAFNKDLLQYRTEIAARKSAMGWEINDLREEICRLKAVASRRETKFKVAFLNQRRLWKHRVKAARRKALQDVCDVLNHKPRQ
jgi:hypothetical protein